MAIGVRESARRLGVRVPEDLSVIGIDDYVLSGVLGLTTVRQDVAAQGREAARLLLRALAEGDTDREQVVLPTELVVRDSTGPVPVGSTGSSPARSCRCSVLRRRCARGPGRRRRRR